MCSPPISVDDLRRLSLDILSAAGCAAAESIDVVEALLWGELTGRRTQGLDRLALYLARHEAGSLHSPCQPAWEQRSDTIALLCGDHGFGPHVARLGVEKAVALAKQSGLGMVAVRESNHLGALSYYLKLACEQGVVCLAMSNSFPRVTIPGAHRPVFGTNPLGFGVPRVARDPILIDLSCGAISGGEVRASTESAGELPEGVAVDAAGRPTRDPLAARQGALLPFGGPKGYCLALMVEVLCGVLTGAAFAERIGSLERPDEGHADLGHFFLALDPARFDGREPFAVRIERLCQWIHSVNRPEGDEAVRLPGEVRWQTFRQQMKDGIALEDRTRTSLEKIARKYDIRCPWKTN